MHFISEAYWEKGKRASNQDTLSLQEVELKNIKMQFAVVCDGMGGLWEGEQASGYVAEQMTEWFYREAVRMLGRRKSAGRLLRAGTRILYGCHEKMTRFAQDKGVRFGTTVTALLLVKRRYYLWHIGDSCLYRVTSFAGRERVLRMTQIHAIGKHRLTGCIGSFPFRQPEMKSGRLLSGKNSFLLCTDGFWRRLEEEKLKNILRPQELSREEQLQKRLSEIAGYVKKRGEGDNLSAILIRTGL